MLIILCVIVVQGETNKKIEVKIGEGLHLVQPRVGSIFTIQYMIFMFCSK